MQDVIAVQGYRTGFVTNRGTTRKSLVFDCSHIDFADSIVLSGCLELDVAATTSVSLVDPSEEVTYGAGLQVPGFHGALRIPLTPEAIGDLQQAGGAFFSVDAIVRGEDGLPAEIGIPHLRVGTIARARTSAPSAAA